MRTNEGTGRVGVSFAFNGRRRVTEGLFTSFARGRMGPLTIRASRARRFPERAMAGVRGLNFLKVPIPGRCNNRNYSPLACIVYIRRLTGTYTAADIVISTRASLYYSPVLACNARRRGRGFLGPLTSNRLLNTFTLARPNTNASTRNTRAGTILSNSR